MDWDEEPATRQQLLHLAGYGFVPAGPLTVTEAARLIRQYRRKPLQPSIPPASGNPQPGKPASSNPVPFAPQDPGPLPSGADLSDSARAYAHRLRLEVESAKKAMEQNPEGPNVRADFHSRTTSRREFWIDTCRETKEMRIGSVQVFEFHQSFGARFFAPNNEQVQQVIEALDGAIAAWEKDCPELFYQTLDLNFPSLLRHRSPNAALLSGHCARTVTPAKVRDGKESA